MQNEKVISRKTSQQFLISIAGCAMPFQDSFRIAEILLLRGLDKELELAKTGELSASRQITKKELLTIIHALTIRKV